MNQQLQIYSKLHSFTTYVQEFMFNSQQFREGGVGGRRQNISLMFSDTWHI